MDNVGLWMRPESDRGLLARLGGGGDYVEYLPVGVIGIAVPASLPLLRTADILASALAAGNRVRSEEHTSELQSLMRISYAVFCLQKKHKPANYQIVHADNAPPNHSILYT